MTITSNLTSIGSYAFENCQNLTSISIPTSVTSIGMRAFENCSSLESIVIPEKVNAIGSQAFSSCSSLTFVLFENVSNWFVSYLYPNSDISLSENDLVEPTTAATYLKSTYTSSWYKK